MRIIADGRVTVIFGTFVGSSFFNFCKARTLGGRGSWVGWPECTGMAERAASRTDVSNMDIARSRSGMVWTGRSMVKGKIYSYVFSKQLPICLVVIVT